MSRDHKIGVTGHRRHRSEPAPTAKAVIDETFPHYLGLYNGKASQPHVREAIENSDCLLSIGYRPIDLTTGDFTGSLPADTIHPCPRPLGGRGR